MPDEDRSKSAIDFKEIALRLTMLDGYFKDIVTWGCHLHSSTIILLNVLVQIGNALKPTDYVISRNW